MVKDVIKSLYHKKREIALIFVYDFHPISRVLRFSSQSFFGSSPHVRPRSRPLSDARRARFSSRAIAFLTRHDIATAIPDIAVYGTPHFIEPLGAHPAVDVALPMLPVPQADNLCLE